MQNFSDFQYPFPIATVVIRTYTKTNWATTAKECHTEQGFEVLNNKFNHNRTGFALTGKRQRPSVAGTATIWRFR
jgi:hypothetical protein